MATILLPSKWATMPSQPVELNGSNPFVQDLVFAMLGNPATGYKDFVSDKFPTPSGSISAGIVANDWAVKLPVNGNLDYGHTAFDDITSAGTLLIKSRPNGNGSNYRTLISREDINTGDGVWLLYDDLNQVPNGFNLGSNNTNYRVDSTSGALGTNSEQFVQTFGCSFNSTTVRMYANDKIDKTTALALPVNANTGRTTRVQGSSAAATEVVHAYAFDRDFNVDEWRSIYNEPYQIFKPTVGRIYFIGSAGGADGTASGSLDDVTLSAPTGSASASSDANASGSVSGVTTTSVSGNSTGAGNSSGSLPQVTETAPSASALGGSGNTATGSVAQSNVTAPTGASVGYASASGSVFTATLSSPSGVASGGIGATASGSIPTSGLVVTTANAVGNAIVSSSIATCALVAPQGNASSGASATGTGDIAQVVLSAITASVYGYANTSGNLNNITTTNVNGVATGETNASGTIQLVSLSTVIGSASGSVAGVTATGDIANVYAGVVNASVSASSVISSSIDSVLLVAPNGSASVGNLYVPRVVINIQAQPRTIKLKVETRVVKIK